MNTIRIINWKTKKEYYLPFNSETYSAYTTTNLDFDTEILRYGYQSLKTPSSLVDFNMKTKEKTILKEQEVLGGTFDKDNYIIKGGAEVYAWDLCKLLVDKGCNVSLLQFGKNKNHLIYL